VITTAAISTITAIIAVTVYK
jgi:hypothetical protein